ncbi:hypothetical protein [Guptibacillus algicola]|uniref:hypothetical protein n=1 Tax=Guptibacillus algicola TaxID=225844 RepID=UPI001CD80889|nr:hypothetical protein [Alkalihalobacillus algicola]MCA0987341.1 hypothetical protein [Alkalihalobacillus algicola]
MNVLAEMLLSLGLVLAPVVGFFYPYWVSRKGELLSEKRLYGRAWNRNFIISVRVLARLMSLK